MPLEGDTLTGLMVANLSLSLIELISGVMGWAQSVKFISTTLTALHN